MEKTVPEWVVAFIDEWKALLMLGEWSFKVKVDHAPDEDGTGETCAVVELWPDIRLAEITLQDSVGKKPSPAWRHNLLHELVHVRLAGMTEPVLQDILPELAPAAQTVAERWYRHEVEEAVELLTHVMLELKEANGEGDE